MSNDPVTLASMKLATNGSNWVTYQDQLIRTFNSRGLSNHLTSTTFPATHSIAGIVNSQSPKQRWEAEEVITKNWITATVPDPIWNQIKSKTTTKEVWEAMKAIHQPTSKKTTVDLRNELQTMKLDKEGNAHAHCKGLLDLQVQLAHFGWDWPQDKEFTYILLCSLPPSYDPIINAVCSEPDWKDTPAPPEQVIQLIINEYNR